MEINQWQDQIVLGTLLGSGFMVRSIQKETPNYYVGMSETRNDQWFNYKCQELALFAAKTPVCRSANALKWRSKAGANWHCYWNQFHDAEGNLTVQMETLDKLKDTALAVWFGDKGFWYTSRRLGLRTGKFKDGNFTICKYFNEVGIPCDIRTDANNTTRCIFTREGTIAFFATCGHCLPEFMLHRLETKN